MRRFDPITGCRFAIALLVTLTLTACGGGGGASTGDRDGDDTPPVITDLAVPAGLQGVRGLGHEVQFVYHVRDNEYDVADVEIEFGVDRDGDGSIGAHEFRPATPGPSGDGRQDVGTAPGAGRSHIASWDSMADAAGGRHLRSDVVYDEDGREIRDPDGEIRTEARPGVVIRVRAKSRGTTGAWRYSEPFELNNNTPPEVRKGPIEVPPEGLQDGTVNELVGAGFHVRDDDGHDVKLLVDYVFFPADMDPGDLSEEELVALNWRIAHGAIEGVEGRTVPATAEWASHQFRWDSVSDAGAVEERILLRYRLLDDASEPSDWEYLDDPLKLRNREIFADSGATLTAPRTGLAATLLPDGTVLVTGGHGEGGEPSDAAATFLTGKLAVPRGALHAIAGGMSRPRSGHISTHLPDGRVLLAGGASAGGVPVADAEIYDPGSRSFSLLNSEMAVARRDHAAIALRTGEILLAGGTGPDGEELSTTEIFDPLTKTFRPGPSFFGGPRTGCRAVALTDGRVLFAGGTLDGEPLATIELYDEVAGIFFATDVESDLSTARNGLLLSSSLHAEFEAAAVADSIELFDATTDRWTLSSANPETGHSSGTSVLLPDGRILLAGGLDIQQNRVAHAEIYDPVDDAIDATSGVLPFPVAGATAVSMSDGRVAFFGGSATDGPTDRILLYVPDRGTNLPPSVQIRTPVAPERAPNGVRILWRGVDPEGDPVRVAGWFRVDVSTGDDSGDLPDSLTGRWLAATVQASTSVGRPGSGLSGLDTVFEATDDPIDAPDVDPGEHLLVWDALADLPAGDYTRVSFRIIPFGAIEGEGASTEEFTVLENAPVIARATAPLNDFGHLVVPFYLQDGNRGERARVRWEFGVDGNGDGRILAADGESWSPATHSTETVRVDGVDYRDAGAEDLLTASDATDPENDYTDPNGVPWGKHHAFVWDSVKDLGAPASPRLDVVLRVTPYDDLPEAEAWTRAGVPGEIAGFPLRHDPDHLMLVRWNPTVTGDDDESSRTPNGVRLNEPIEFEFSGRVEPTSLSKHSIRIEGPDGTPVDGYFRVDNSGKNAIVTFYPQVAELPARADVLAANTTYRLRIPGFDPAMPTAAVVRRAGAPVGDTSRRHFLLTKEVDPAFRTGDRMLEDRTAPVAEALVSPGRTTDVPVQSGIEVHFGERIDASSVTPANFRVIVRSYFGRDTVITGEVKLVNVVDSSGKRGSVREYARLILSPDLNLPSGSTGIEVHLGAGIRDLAGNELSRERIYVFTTERGDRDVDASFVEEFDDGKMRDAQATTAFWGTEDPAEKGTANGSGTRGLLTGMLDGGDGSDGKLDFSKGDITLDTDRQAIYEFTNLYVPKGRTLRIRGKTPARILVQYDVLVEGTIDVSGSDGQNPIVRDANSDGNERSGVGASGGRGGPGGGAGASAGTYEWRQSTPVTSSSGTSAPADPDKSSGGGAGTGVVYHGNEDGGGGGGGGHASSGSDGDSGDSSGGAGGGDWGSKDLDDAEGGSGGGAGGGVVYYDAGKSSIAGFASGGGGGGGGGTLHLSTNSRILISGTGRILAKGGDGGGAPFALIYLQPGGPKSEANADDAFEAHPGGGGGGSGGSIHLRAGEGLYNDGVLDVRGGRGGVGFSSNDVETAGGDGGDGRVRIEAPNIDEDGLVDITGSLSGETDALTFDGDSEKDWLLGTDTVVNTDTGFGTPSGSFEDGRILVRDFVLKPGVTLVVEGSNPLRVYATGKVEIHGVISARGQPGGSSAADDGNSTEGWKFSSVKGGTSAGGGAGGGNGADGSPSEDFPAAKAGESPTRDGGGQPGGPGQPIIRRYKDHRLLEWYFSGGGGGGGSAAFGEAGRVISSVFGYAGEPGRGGAPTIDPRRLDDRNIAGGAGGGGGGCGGYIYDWTSEDFIDTYYSLGRGAGGGGGGAGIAILTRGTFGFSGRIDVRGGAGGDVKPGAAANVPWAGAGGGGGSGNVVLSAGKGFVLDAPITLAVGGAPGVLEYDGRIHGRGGRGAEGAVVFRGLDGLVLLNRARQYLVGDGTLTATGFKATRHGQSDWFDTKDWVPSPTFAGLTLGGSANLLVQGAQTDPLTGEADEQNLTAWTQAKQVGSLRGCRWLRFRVELVPGRFEPRVDRVKIDYRVRK